MDLAVKRLSVLSEDDEEVLKKKPNNVAGDGTTYKTLSAAVKANDFNAVKEKLDSGSLPDLNNCNGWTSVHHAASMGHTEILKLLLRKHKKHLSNLKNWMNETPLIVACHSTNINAEVVRILLKAGCQVNHADHLGMTALSLACEKPNNLDVVKILVENGADVNHYDSLNMFLPIHLALYSKDTDVVKYLAPLSNVDHCNAGNEDTLLMALHHLPDIAHMILPFAKNAPDERHMDVAVRRGAIQVVCELIRMGVNARGKFGLSYSCKGYVGDFLPIHYVASRAPEHFQVLLDSFPSSVLREYHISGGYPLEVYIHKYSPAKNQLLELLLQYRARPDNEDESFTHVLPKEHWTLYKYFLPPPFYNRCESLREICRLRFREYLRSQVQSDWAAYCMLRDMNIPRYIKSYLFFEVL